MFLNFCKNNEIIYKTNLSISFLSKGTFVSSILPKIKVKTQEKLYLGISKNNSKKIIFKDFYYKNEICKLKEIFNNLGVLEDFLKEFNFNFGIEVNVFSIKKTGFGFGITGAFASLIASFIGEEFNFSSQEKIKLAFKVENILKTNTSGVDSYVCFLDNKDIFTIIDGKEKKVINLLDNGANYFDYYIFYSGTTIKQDFSEQLINHDKQFIKNLVDNFENNFLKNNNKNLENIGKNLGDSFLGIFYFIILKIIDAFGNLKKDIFDEQNIDKLFKALNLQKNILFLLSNESRFYLDLKKNFELLKTNKQEKIAIIPSYSGKTGGSFLVCVKSQISRKTIDNLEKKLKDFHPNSKIVYKSFEDNGDISQIELIQNIEKNIFANKNSKKFILKTTLKNYIVSDLKEVFNMGYEVIFDKVNNDIYIGEKKLTSKDIHSRTTVIDLFSNLIQKNTILNTQLPKSSYSALKSEMGGKIIYPIKNLIKNILNSEIDLQIKGKSSNFEIIYTPGELKIAVFENI